MTDDEKSVWAEHFAQLQRLLAAGQLILAGPTLARGRPCYAGWWCRKSRVRWLNASTFS